MIILLNSRGNWKLKCKVFFYLRSSEAKGISVIGFSILICDFIIFCRSDSWYDSNYSWNVSKHVSFSNWPGKSLQSVHLQIKKKKVKVVLHLCMNILFLASHFVVNSAFCPNAAVWSASCYASSSHDSTGWLGFCFYLSVKINLSLDEEF